MFRILSEDEIKTMKPDSGVENSINITLSSRHVDVVELKLAHRLFMCNRDIVNEVEKNKIA